MSSAKAGPCRTQALSGCQLDVEGFCVVNRWHGHLLSWLFGNTTIQGALGPLQGGTGWEPGWGTLLGLVYGSGRACHAHFPLDVSFGKCEVLHWAPSLSLWVSVFLMPHLLNDDASTTLSAPRFAETRPMYAFCLRNVQE